MSNQLSSRYQPSDIEQKWYEKWEKSGVFATQKDGDSFVIMLPPPNVTGTLHMGHAFQDTLMDCLIRYHKMAGKNTLWQVGTDHAGIATQMVVERQLQQLGQNRQDFSRKDFVDKVWQWKEQSGGAIMQQMRRLGVFADWQREKFTMDKDLSIAVRQIFIKLYQDGLIYRGKRLVNWDPKLQTAVSDLEVENRQEKGFLYQIRYPIVENGELTGQFLQIATTRPETILADGALAAHPDDERYQHLFGKSVKIPLTDRVIPIIADEYPDPNFGTGCVKITAAHDFNDYQVGRRHNLSMINIFNLDASLNHNAPEKYRGLSRENAREQILLDLEKEGFLVQVEPHELTRPYGDRSGVVLEPLLTDQWFVDLTSEKGQRLLTQPAIEAVKSGRINFVPNNWQNTYFHWLNNIEDWCISRQLWWGHQIPAWYDKDGNVYVGENEQQIRNDYQLSEDIILNQDQDVLDTWFSSALWPFATLGWPEKTADLARFYPTSVLVTGFDIIFFWVARMVLFGQYAMQDVPFKTVYIHGLVRDSQGQKMSKSKGNVIDPVDIIDGIDLPDLLKKRTSGLMQPKLAKQITDKTKQDFPQGISAFGTDALRFMFASQATLGRDVLFDVSRLESARNFCNKLWNAARFVLLQTDQSITKPVQIKNPVNLWIYDELNQTIDAINQAISEYRFDFMANRLYEFIWNKYCDWYLELTKPQLKDLTDQETRFVLLDVLEKTLRLLHSLMPFVTEELWQKMKEKLPIDDDLLINSSLPQKMMVDKNHCLSVIWLQEVLSGIRQIRSSMNISPSKKITIIFNNLSDKHLQYLSDLKTHLIALAKIDQLLIQDVEPDKSAVFLVDGTKVFLPFAGLIELEQELARLDKQIAKLTINIDKLKNQLNNPDFLKNAPEKLINQLKNQLDKAEINRQELINQKQKLV